MAECNAQLYWLLQNAGKAMSDMKTRQTLYLPYISTRVHRCGSDGLHSRHCGIQSAMFGGIQSSKLAIPDELIDLQPMQKHDNPT